MAKGTGDGAGALEMDPEEMRRLGYRVVDAVVDRWEGLVEEVPWRGGTRRELEPLLQEEAPEVGRDADDVLRRVLTEVLPRAGRIDHPRFFAFIPSSPTWPAVLGDVLATGFNVFQGTWLESAGPSQLELVVMDWFRSWLGFPEGAGGLLTSGGSAANLVAVVAAREGRQNPTEPVIYVSDQGHSSLERGAGIAGIPESCIRKIPTDEAFRMRVTALRDAVVRDREEGRTPLLVCGNAGATNTGAVDPLRELAVLAREEDLWFHVDGAYGGFAVLTPDGNRALEGIQEADSVTLDPHKWLFQPYEAGCLLVRDVRRLEDAFRIVPEYLQDTALGEEQVNFADRGVQLTRRFRALKIWLSVQVLGLGAFREAIAQGMELAREAEAHIRRSTDLELLGPASMGIVCFRYRPSREARGAGLDEEGLERLNEEIQERILRTGVAMMSSTRLRGAYSLRLCIMNYRSTREDVLETLNAVEGVGRALLVAREKSSGGPPGSSGAAGMEGS